jgi:hypothetical protein
MLTVESLTTQLTELEQELEAAKSQVYRIDGAMSATKHILAQLQAANKPSTPSDPASVPAETA